MVLDSAGEEGRDKVFETQSRVLPLRKRVQHP